MPRSSELLWYALWITLVAVGALIAAVVVSRIIRKRLELPDRSPSFTLQDLRELRDAGQISEQEYHAMRAAIIGEVSTPHTSETPADPALPDTDSDDAWHRGGGEPPGPPD